MSEKGTPWKEFEVKERKKNDGHHSRIFINNTKEIFFFSSRFSLFIILYKDLVLISSVISEIPRFNDELHI